MKPWQESPLQVYLSTRTHQEFQNQLPFPIHLQINTGAHGTRNTISLNICSQCQHFNFLQLLPPFMGTQEACPLIPTTCFQWDRVWRVWVALVLTGSPQECCHGQLCYDVWDVAKGTQVLQTFMSSTCQEIKSRSFQGNAIHFNHYLFRHHTAAKHCVLCCGEKRKYNSSCPQGVKIFIVKTGTDCINIYISTQGTPCMCYAGQVKIQCLEQRKGRVSLG